MKILLIADNLHEELGIGSRRWRQLIPVLAQKYDMTIDVLLLWNQVSDLKGLQNIYCYTDHKQPGTGVVRKRKIGFVREHFLNLKVFRHIRNALRIPIVLQYLPKKHQQYGINTAKKFLKENPQPGYNVLIATQPGISTVWAANYIFEQTGIPFVADFRDPYSWPISVDFRKSNAFYQRLRKTEGDLLQNSAHVVTATEGMKKYINHSGSLTTVFNSFEQETSRDHKENHRFDKRNINLVYTGSVFRYHRLEQFFSMVKRFNRDNTTQIFFHYYGRTSSHINLIANRTRCGLWVKDHGNVSYSESRSVQKSADILLLLSLECSTEDMILTGKVLEYVESGRPVICIGGENDLEIKRLFRKTDVCFHVTNYSEFKHVIDRIMEGINSKTCIRPPGQSHVIDRIMEGINSHFDNSMLEEYTLSYTSRQIHTICKDVAYNRL